MDNNKKMSLYYVSIAIKLADVKRWQTMEWKGVTYTGMLFVYIGIPECPEFLFQLSHVYVHLSSFLISEFKAHQTALFTVPNEKNLYYS